MKYLNLCNNNLADSFNYWLDLLVELTGERDITWLDQETWDLIRQYEFNDAPLFENVYQDLLLRALQDAIADYLAEQFADNLYGNVDVHYYVNASCSDCSITYRTIDYEEDWRISDKASLDAAIEEIRQIEFE